jgi:hypothetical protein
VSGVHLGKSLNGTELRVGVNPGPTQDEWEARSPGVHYNIGDVAAAAADGNVACHMDSRPAALSAAVGQKQHLEKPNKDLPSNATGGTILLIDTKPGAQRQVAFKNVQVSANGLFELFLYKMHPSFYQDRLGTNIGKTQMRLLGRTIPRRSMWPPTRVSLGFRSWSFGALCKP